jgi:hypothetical protein
MGAARHTDQVAARNGPYFNSLVRTHRGELGAVGGKRDAFAVYVRCLRGDLSDEKQQL